MFKGQYFHHGYVTRDLSRGIEVLSKLYGVTFEHLKGTDNASPESGVPNVRVKIALGWHGNLEYELIEPVSGDVAFYREVFAEDHTPRLHHMGVLVSDWNRLEADIAARGLPVVLSGDLGEIKFAYVDTRAELGHYMEYMWMSDGMWASRSRNAKGLGIAPS